MAKITKSTSTVSRSGNSTTTISRSSSKKSFISSLSAYSIFTITLLLVLISPYLINGFSVNDIRGDFYDPDTGYPMDGDVIATPDFIQFGSVGIDAIKNYVGVLSDIGETAGSFTDWLTSWFESSDAVLNDTELENNYPAYWEIYILENFNYDSNNAIYWKRVEYNVWTSKYVKLYVEENKYYLETYNWMSAVRTSKVLLTDNDLADIFG